MQVIFRRICQCSTILLLTATTAFAQDEKADYLNSALQYGGITMKVLIALSMVTFALAVYYLLTLRRQQVMPQSLLQEAEVVAQKGDVAALVEICRSSNAAGARVIGAAAQLLRENPDADYMVVRDVIEDEGSRQSDSLWERIRFLQDIAKLAPMIGLLGTVLGMIDAFQGMMNNVTIGGIKPAGLTEGVSKALITTAGGLIVGIIATVLYALFRSRVGKLTAYLEESCSIVLQRFVHHRES